ncbi:MAG: hypothetical protein AAF704_15885, partial [Cyanobacteria bacterium P01_D01_bin.123]
VDNTFAQSLAARIQEHCFEYLDAPVRTIGSVSTPAIPLNSVLEQTMIPSIEKVQATIENLLALNFIEFNAVVKNSLILCLGLNEHD